jgi:AcrR family transcriptional regulator
LAVKERIRTGGRSARIQSAVHQAVKKLSAATCRDELTVPQIAAQAGVTPSTIYRRWGDLSALLADVAIERLRPIADPEDTGAVASDLRLFIEQYMEEMSSEVGRALIRDVFAVASGDSHADQCAHFTYDHLATIAERAKARGEAVFDVDEVIDQVVAPILYHILFGHRELTLDYCHSLLSRVTSLQPAPVAIDARAKVRGSPLPARGERSKPKASGEGAYPRV